MKTIISIALIFFSISLFSQTAVKTETIAVRGNCEQCKKRIENAADIKGVKVSNWDEKTQALSVTYDPSKTTIEQIRKAVAAKGHDAGEFKADDKSYKKLPGCCKYRDRKCETPEK